MPQVAAQLEAPVSWHMAAPRVCLPQVGDLVSKPDVGEQSSLVVVLITEAILLTAQLYCHDPVAGRIHTSLRFGLDVENDVTCAQRG